MVLVPKQEIDTMNSIPRLNTSYWLLMLLCTTMGELIGNLLSRNFELGYTRGAVLDVCVFGATIFLFMAFAVKNEIFYWILIIFGNIGGTNLADWVTLEPLESDKSWGLLKPLELGTKVGSLVVLGALLIVLFIRYISAKREDSKLSKVLYWAAILLSSTFGTTSGDFITNDTPLGALGGSLFLMVVLIFIYFAYRSKIISVAAAYWSALVVMHPVGATLGNYISKPIGLNLGNVFTNIAMVALFGLIYFLDLRHRGDGLTATSHPRPHSK
jgi:uncharacterized membrane-anchored protein